MKNNDNNYCSEFQIKIFLDIYDDHHNSLFIIMMMWPLFYSFVVINEVHVMFLFFNLFFFTENKNFKNRQNIISFSIYISISFSHYNKQIQQQQQQWKENFNKHTETNHKHIHTHLINQFLVIIDQINANAKKNSKSIEKTQKIIFQEIIIETHIIFNYIQFVVKRKLKFQKNKI